MKYRIELLVNPSEFHLYLGKNQLDLNEDNCNEFEHSEYEQLVQIGSYSNINGMEDPEDLDWSMVLEVRVTDENGKSFKLDRTKFKIGKLIEDQFDFDKLYRPSTTVWVINYIKYFWYSVEFDLDEEFDENKFSFVQRNYFEDTGSFPDDISFLDPFVIMYDGKEYFTSEEDCDLKIYNRFFSITNLNKEDNDYDVIDSENGDEDVVENYWELIDNLDW